MAIIGISGSPIVNGNTDRMTQAALTETGKDTKFTIVLTIEISDFCAGKQLYNNGL